jgi:hypothetical protein
VLAHSSSAEATLGAIFSLAREECVAEVRVEDVVFSAGAGASQGRRRRRAMIRAGGWRQAWCSEPVAIDVLVEQVLGGGVVAGDEALRANRAPCR